MKKWDDIETWMILNLGYETTSILGAITPLLIASVVFFSSL